MTENYTSRNEARAGGLRILSAIPADVAAKIDAIYARIPAVPCQRKCQQACGPILMSSFEWARICNQLHRVPTENRDLTCPMLKHGTDCRVYAIRPAICRIWGAVEKMACPWGCRPDQWLSDAEAHAILDELEALDKT